MQTILHVLNLFGISPKYQLHFSIFQNELILLIFYHNKKIVFSQKQTSSNVVWRETKDVNRFFLSDLENCLKNFNGFDIMCKDVNGNINKIYYNTASIIYDAFKKNIFEDVLLKPIKIKSVNLNNNESFLNHTITYIDK